MLMIVGSRRLTSQVNKRGVRLVLLLAVCGLSGASADAQTFTCNPPMANPIVCENSKPGNPSSEWDVSGIGDPSIQGFATDMSVNQGDIVHFKINTTATSYRIDIYRMGYYAGMGARRVVSVLPTAALPQMQPSCLSDSSTGLIDCGNWAESASWAVPADATSGIYFARLVRADTGGASHVFFIVRSDAGGSDLLFQTSDTGWQAYNSYGGNSLYLALPQGRAYKVSYNRPFFTRDSTNNPTWVFNAEYPMVRWLEANGYNVSYFTGVDTDRFGSLISTHRVFLSVGHDEYWSGNQRANVEAARAAGVHLTFFSGNESFWKTRWESSVDGSNTPYRTLVCYKETHANAPIDPDDPPTWTGTWRDPRFSPPADGGRPENALSGTIYYVDSYRRDSITVPAAYGGLRFWRNTSIATLAAGTTYTFPPGTLGYEWDQDVDNGFRPAGLVDMSSTTVDVSNSGSYLQDYGSTYGAGVATHNLTLYRANSGALVFGAGTVQWSWGLDNNHDNGSSPPDPNMQQATVNLFADMGIQPATLQAGLVAATASTDTVPPTSTITSPGAGATLQAGRAVMITGTASDTGGGVVADVEVSVDGGATWHRAWGLNNWTYAWTPSGSGQLTLKSVAIDDSSNIEIPSAGVTVTVAAATVSPAISTVQSTTITATSATINWTTDVPATSQVDYGATTSYGTSTTLDNTPVTNHVVNLGGLNANTLYHFRVDSRDGSGSLNTSGDFTFSTNGALTLWSNTVTPGSISTDTSPIEVGVQFTSDVPGSIVGVRFYKGGTNTGAHVANLWTNTGTLLATVTFGTETAFGWQQINFLNPVAITPGTAYVASYHTNVGGYADDTRYFMTSGVDKGPLHAPQDGASGGHNGVFQYGSGGFPTNTVLSTNYWVDVLFTPAPPALSSVTLNPTSVTGGASSTGTVTLANPAPTGGASVTLASSNTMVASTPSSVTVTAGSTSATFTVTTSPVIFSTSVTISATYQGTTQSANLSVGSSAGLSSAR
jgi:hypothetical protein